MHPHHPACMTLHAMRAHACPQARLLGVLRDHAPREPVFLRHASNSILLGVTWFACILTILHA